MIRVRQIKVEIEKDNDDYIRSVCSKKLRIDTKDIVSYKISKKSIDARHKPNIFYSYVLDVEVLNEDKILNNKRVKDISKTPIEEYIYPVMGNKELSNRPVVVGAGPCGLFCAYMLAKMGYNPLVIERGSNVDERVSDVEEFWNNGKLNLSSNVQFGEGGAGTFSDGKLNTLVKDKKHIQKMIFSIFVECGAPKEILYEAKPHIGTDLLRNVVKNMRNKIISMGGEFRFKTCLTNIITNNNKISSIEVNNKEVINTNVLVLAIGHSARDTFKMLYDNKFMMEAKPFAVGIRIMHQARMINKVQYGDKYRLLPAASYKLTYKASNNRGVYTFCMCPGGVVVNSSSEKDKLVINGMSNYKRDSDNSNSAVIVTVNPSDFGKEPLDGVEFQRKLESLAYKEGNGMIPIQLYGDLKRNVLSTEFGEVFPIFKGNYAFSNIRNILPSYVIDSLIEGIDAFDKKIKGFNRDDSIIVAVESRTSSPVKIIRDENLESNIMGIYPAGEGAGYAGGIVSAAIDGVKVFEEIVKTYKSLKK